MNESNIDLNALTVLLAVVSAGGFAPAARRLSVPANRLSRQIQRLEDHLGVQLLQRTTRRLSLTSAGRAMLEGTEAALQQIESTWRQVEAGADEPSGHLRVAAPASFLDALTAEHLSTFLSQHPKISLEMILSDDVVDLLASGIDMAFRAGPIRDETLIARRVASTRLIVVASPACVSAHGFPDHPAALASYPCLVARGKDGRGLWPLSGPEGEVPVQVRARLTINGMGALVTAAIAGMGAALVPEILATAAINSQKLLHLVPQYCQPGEFFAVYPSRRNPPAAVRALLDFVIAQVGSTGNAKAQGQAVQAVR